MQQMLVSLIIKAAVQSELIKTMLNSAEHENLNAHKYKNIKLFFRHR